MLLRIEQWLIEQYKRKSERDGSVAIMAVIASPASLHPHPMIHIFNHDIIWEWWRFVSYSLEPAVRPAAVCRLTISGNSPTWHFRYSKYMNISSMLGNRLTNDAQMRRCLWRFWTNYAFIFSRKGAIPKRLWHCHQSDLIANFGRSNNAIFVDGSKTTRSRPYYNLPMAWILMIINITSKIVNVCC